MHRLKVCLLTCTNLSLGLYIQHHTWSDQSRQDQENLLLAKSQHKKGKEMDWGVALDCRQLSKRIKFHCM